MIVQRKVLDRRFYSCYKVDNRLFDCVLIGPSPLVVRRSLVTLNKRGSYCEQIRINQFHCRES